MLHHFELKRYQSKYLGLPAFWRVDTSGVRQAIRVFKSALIRHSKKCQKPKHLANRRQAYSTAALLLATGIMDGGGLLGAAVVSRELLRLADAVFQLHQASKQYRQVETRRSQLTAQLVQIHNRTAQLAQQHSVAQLERITPELPKPDLTPA
ncbi:MAG: hypothetical protein LBU38_06010 [Propionibacteriaceae bacterium]|jgi:hypothetical protein|nr:hypothetical protein [Propionibacteriaceae bacterium]